ncbi:MAG: hypothetical protein JHD35_03260 [Sphingopyxis sp.]|nr:hypothetical protein [Sphingopyxis sp.]
MSAMMEASNGDLPTLLDTLTIAVTTLDAVGVESFNELYLYVVGTTADQVVRDLRVEDGQLIVGPPGHALAYESFIDRDFEATRRALMLAELCSIMRIWRWSPATMAAYLRCSAGILSAWVGRSAWVDVPALPRSVVERFKRLSLLDRTRSICGVADQDMPNWLSSKRPSFGRRSIEQVLQSEDIADFIQLVMWSLNGPQHTSVLH